MTKKYNKEVSKMQEKIKPFVKWAGGKGSLLSQLNRFYPFELKAGQIRRYVEPFVGGGAVLIDILQNYKVQEAYAFDINIDLINAYNVIKHNSEKLIQKLRKIEKEYLSLGQEDRKMYFYERRKQYNSYVPRKNKESIKRAGEFIFLNRTCFNGLYRVNKSGKFNVPIGSYKNPTICDEINLRQLANLIQKVTFQCADYKKSMEYVTQDTFVYFDPPYRPLNDTSAFTSYTKEVFNDDNQRELAMFYKTLYTKEAKLMLSNSNPKNVNQQDVFFEELYHDFYMDEIYAKRTINANWRGRGEIPEIIVTSYQID